MMKIANTHQKLRPPPIGGAIYFIYNISSLKNKKEQNEKSWCEKKSDSRISAPLILNPTEDGKMVDKIRKMINNYNIKEKVDI